MGGELGEALRDEGARGVDGRGPEGGQTRRSGGLRLLRQQANIEQEERLGAPRGDGDAPTEQSSSTHTKHQRCVTDDTAAADDAAAAADAAAAYAIFVAGAPIRRARLKHPP